MALRQIVKIGEPVLRKKSKVVKEINDRLIDLLDDMADTMYEADCVSRAAPQVLILKRVVVIDIGDGLIELINPEIIETEGEYLDNEGCLSVPGECGDVLRPYRVKVRALNRFGETIEIEGEELLARAFCHEIDHLDGILYIDKVIK